MSHRGWFVLGWMCGLVKRISEFMSVCGSLHGEVVGQFTKFPPIPLVLLSPLVSLSRPPYLPHSLPLSPQSPSQPTHSASFSRQACQMPGLHSQESDCADDGGREHASPALNSSPCRNPNSRPPTLSPYLPSLQARQKHGGVAKSKTMREVVANGLSKSVKGVWRVLSRSNGRESGGGGKDQLDTENFAETVMTQFGEMVSKSELPAPEPASQKKKEADELKVRTRVW